MTQVTGKVVNGVPCIKLTEGGEYKPMTFLHKVLTQFNQAATAQELKGLEKYGHELQPMDPKWDWLKMAKEELVDGFKYLAAEQERREIILTAADGMLQRIMHTDRLQDAKDIAEVLRVELALMRGPHFNE
jgi:hypothetical protein